MPPVVLGIALGGSLAVGAVGGVLTDPGPWSAGLVVPAWKPPGWLFGPVWGLIFVLAGIGAAHAWHSVPRGTQRLRLVILLTLNATLNIAWSGLFFGLHRPGWALADLVLLWLSLVALVIHMRPWSEVAASALFPYMVWVGFAGFLNAAIVALNPTLL